MNKKTMKTPKPILANRSLVKRGVKIDYITLITLQITQQIGQRQAKEGRVKNLSLYCNPHGLF